MEPGFQFPQGPKDAVLNALKKNKNPGPDKYNIRKFVTNNTDFAKTMG